MVDGLLSEDVFSLFRRALEVSWDDPTSTHTSSLASNVAIVPK